MKKDRFDLLTKQFSAYEMEFSKDGDLVEIINPFGCENIRVEYIPDDDFTPYIVYFAFQHCHMCDVEDIVEYIRDLIEGNRFSIEFFKNGVRYFGGDIAAEELKDFVYAIETGCDKETPIEIYKDRAKQHLMLLKKKVEELHNIE